MRSPLNFKVHANIKRFKNKFEKRKIPLTITKMMFLTNWWQTSHLGWVNSLKQDLWYASLPDKENLNQQKQKKNRIRGRHRKISNKHNITAFTNIMPTNVPKSARQKAGGCLIYGAPKHSCVLSSRFFFLFFFFLFKNIDTTTKHFPSFEHE